MVKKIAYSTKCQSHQPANCLNDYLVYTLQQITVAALSEP
jgi:hypothetical protein